MDLKWVAVRCSLPVLVGCALARPAKPRYRRNARRNRWIFNARLLMKLYYKSRSRMQTGCDSIGLRASARGGACSHGQQVAEFLDLVCFSRGLAMKLHAVVITTAMADDPVGTHRFTGKRRGKFHKNTVTEAELKTGKNQQPAIADVV